MSLSPLTKWRIAAILCGSALLFVLGSLVVGELFREGFGLHRLTGDSVVTQVKQLKELVTVKYSIQRVVGLREPKIPFGEESILLMVQGEVLAGVDLDNIRSSDVELSGARVATITLPPAKILHAYLDEKQTKVWDRQITWWTPWVSSDPDLEHKARLQAINDETKAALDMGIMTQAQTNAEKAIRSLLDAFQVQAHFKTRSLD